MAEVAKRDPRAVLPPVSEEPSKKAVWNGDQDQHGGGPPKKDKGGNVEKPAKADVWSRLRDLQHLKSKGVINQSEYIRRKQMLVDELTGTTLVKADVPAKAKAKASGKKRKKKKKYEYHHGFKMGKAAVVAKGPPDFSSMRSERAVQYLFDIETGKWSTRKVKVKIDKEPFARGSLRLAYHMSGLPTDEEERDVTYVAKISIDPYEEREFYFKDVSMQMYTREYAKKYNTYDPPKKIYFIKAYLLELVDRPTKPICAVEKFITGPYRKHNNNFGYVSEDERNTPQAFSHFTYEASQHRILICDIQGVGDMYTDPQIHSRDGVGFGKGNMGDRGFSKFLSSHRCNGICRYLKLPEINAKNEMDDRGTVPSTRYMMHQNVEVINLELKDAHADQILGQIVTRHADLSPGGSVTPGQDKPWCMCTIL